MIEHTFQHIMGFGAAKEKELWQKKVHTWEDYEKTHNLQMRLEFIDTVNIIEESKLMFENKEADYFANKLPHHLYYRIAHSFPERTMFLDLETTGLSRYYDSITIVGWSFLDKYHVHIVGNPGSEAKFLSDLKCASSIVTFNGIMFDLPFIRKQWPDARIPKTHIDLRFFCRRVGLVGGQKNIEAKLNFRRPTEVQEIDGLGATILWHKYKEGDTDSIRRLIMYNAYDIQGMKFLFEKVTLLHLKKEMSFIDKKSVFPFSNYKAKIEFTNEGDCTDRILISRYSGKVGPMIFMKDLPDVGNHKIVGIDLTGSENKASGWALLENGTAITQTIFSDDELIEKTISSKPTVISIDSPLSLPAGRKIVFDDDPGRKQFGITRECERIMARRGVKSYPCLIPSMQKLTQRGILLANKFRKMGFPVIESYPGAAQDILGIPRKRASLEYLVKGLQSFGIRGEYGKMDVTHDEIDAITSALVGYFFLADKFEALGNEDEDYLIIPSLKSQKEQVGGTLVIGLSGHLSSGKTTIGQSLKALGFSYSRYSMVIDTELHKMDKPITRTNQQELGDYINRQKGQRWLGKQLLRLVDNSRKLAIDGLRFPEDHAFLREKFGLKYFHIHVEASNQKRKERFLSKALNDIGFEVASSHQVEGEIDNLREFADIVLSNNGSIQELETELQSIISKICQFQ